LISISVRVILEYKIGFTASITSNEITIIVTPAACIASSIGNPTILPTFIQQEEAKTNSQNIVRYVFTGFSNIDPTCSMTYKASSSSSNYL
jgi:hypothetical protein